MKLQTLIIFLAVPSLMLGMGTTENLSQSCPTKMSRSWYSLPSLSSPSTTISNALRRKQEDLRDTLLGTTASLITDLESPSFSNTLNFKQDKIRIKNRINRAIIESISSYTKQNRNNLEKLLKQMSDWAILEMIETKQKSALDNLIKQKIIDIPDDIIQEIQKDALSLDQFEVINTIIPATNSPQSSCSISISSNTNDWRSCSSSGNDTSSASATPLLSGSPEQSPRKSQDDFSLAPAPFALGSALIGSDYKMLTNKPAANQELVPTFSYWEFLPENRNQHEAYYKSVLNVAKFCQLRFPGSPKYTHVFENNLKALCIKHLYARDLQALAVTCRSMRKLVETLTGGWQRKIECSKTLRGHTTTVEALGINSTNNLIASASSDRVTKVGNAQSDNLVYTIKVWNALSGDLMYTIEGTGCAPYQLQFNEKNEVLAAYSETNVIKWNGTKKVPLEKSDPLVEIPKPPYFVYNSHVNIEYPTKDVKLYSTKTGQHINTIKGQGLGVETINISPDGNFIVTGTRHTFVEIWKRANNYAKTYGELG